MVFYHGTIPVMLEMKFKAVPFCWKIRLRTVLDEYSPSSNLSFHGLKPHALIPCLCSSKSYQVSSTCGVTSQVTPRSSWDLGAAEDRPAVAGK